MAGRVVGRGRDRLVFDRVPRRRRQDSRPGLARAPLLAPLGLDSWTGLWPGGPTSRLPPVGRGAALFFVSDMLLACGLFRGNLPYQTELVWLTYSPGQMLIVFGAWWARGLLTAQQGVASGRPAGAGAAG